MIRDWGRDCYCGYENPPDGKCGKRFQWKVGDDEIYDHRYYFTEIGYNLKMTELQAAIGLAQLDKLPGFIERRKRNFKVIYDHLKRYEDALLLPTWSPRADPSWFAFPITVRPGVKFDRTQLTRFLERQRVETRFLFAGNILQQPGYRDIDCRVVGGLPNAEVVLRRTFFVGVYPGLDDARLAQLLAAFDKFFETV